MAGFNLLVYLEQGPVTKLSYFQNYFKPLQINSSVNHLNPGTFVAIRDFIEYWDHYKRCCIQKREIEEWYNPCFAFYTLDGKWIERPFKSKIDQWNGTVEEYYNSVSDETWLYLLYCKV